MISDVRTPKEHRFLALCMLLMHNHPRIGASLLSVHRGEVLPYSKGWNVIYGQADRTRNCWIFIDDCSGYTTWQNPNIESSKIHEVDYTLPQLSQSTAWIWASHLGLIHHSSDWAQSVLACIQDTSDRIAIPHDPDAEYIAVESSLRTLRQRAPSLKDPGELSKHLLEMMRPYLSLKQPGMIAAPVLTAVLTNIAYFASVTDPVQSQLDLRDTLGDRMTTLLHSRTGMRPGAFEQMTYLAALYGKAALIHSDLVRSQFTLKPEDLRLMKKWDQNVDELLAHEISPYFVYFAMPSVERAFQLEKKKWKSMHNKYGNIDSPVFDYETMNFDKHGPCKMQLLQDTIEQLHRRP